MLDPAHIDLVRAVVGMFTGMLLVWFLVMFLYFWVCERRRLRR